MRLTLEVNESELEDLLTALEGHGLQVAAEDVPRVSLLRNKVLLAAGLEPETVWEDFP